MRYREWDDGTRAYPARGKPPPDMPGFVRDKGNPFLFHPILPECPLRREQEYKTQCCGTAHKYQVCLASGVTTTYKICDKCVKSGQQVTLENQYRKTSNASASDSTQS